MLLEAFLRRIHDMCAAYEKGDCYDCYDIQDIEMVTNILLVVHPNKPEKPKNIFVYYSSRREAIMFTFEYTDTSKNRDLTYDELHQYFCTVLGEKEC